MLEPKNKRGQGGLLHQALKLQVRECKTEANGLVGLPRKKELNWQTQGIDWMIRHSLLTY